MSRKMTIGFSPRIALGLLVVATLFGSTACSSGGESHAVTCGPGTELVDGTCVVSDASSADATSSDSLPSADTTTATDDRTPDVAVSEVTDAKTDASSSSSDPCPSTPMIVNCSKTCGGPTSNCWQAECPAAPSSPTYVKVGAVPAVVRTPDKPGRHLFCPCEIPSGGGSVYSLVVSLDLGTTKLVKVTVGPGWRLPTGTSASNWCGELSDKRTCRIFSGSTSVLITTDDANAPSRNVEIVAATAGDSCP